MLVFHHLACALRGGAAGVLLAVVLSEEEFTALTELLGLASAVGDFFMKYSTIRAGIYLPIWTSLAPQR